MLYSLIGTQESRSALRLSATIAMELPFTLVLLTMICKQEKKGLSCHEKDLISLLHSTAHSRANAGGNPDACPGNPGQGSLPSSHERGPARYLELSERGSVYPEGGGRSAGQRECDRSMLSRASKPVSVPVRDLGGWHNKHLSHLCRGLSCASLCHPDLPYLYGSGRLSSAFLYDPHRIGG